MLKLSEPDRLKELTPSERRRSRRVALAFLIEVSGTQLTGAVFHDRVMTTDISEDGCQFTSQRKLSPGEHLSLGLVNTDFARFTGNTTQPFEVVWAEPGHLGWAVGVRKLRGESIWPVTFPLKRTLPG